MLEDVMKSIESGKIKAFGHIIKHDDFINNKFEGKVDGKKPRGRQRKE